MPTFLIGGMYMLSEELRDASVKLASQCGQWLSVDMRKIDVKLFDKPRDNVFEEIARKAIYKAIRTNGMGSKLPFEIAFPFLDVYACLDEKKKEAFKDFPKETLYEEGEKFVVPEPIVTSKIFQTVINLEELFPEYYVELASFSEVALSWAQRISNGETWKEVCIDPDKAPYYRLAMYGGDIIQIGGASTTHSNRSATIYAFLHRMQDVCYDSVPFIVRRPKKS